MASRYDDELWELAGEHADSPPDPVASFVRALAPAASALDLGCGDGRLSELLRTRELTLADVSALALGRARRRLPGASALELEPDAPLPAPDGAFDLVLCADTIEHVRDVQLLLSEIRRVLRPGGSVAITTPAHGRRTGLAILGRGFERSFPPLSPHLRFLTRRSLRDLLAELGFRVESLESRGGTLLARASR